VATIHDVVKKTIRAHLPLLHVFHAYASADTLWVAHALSHYTPVRYGRIASISVAHDATQFGDSICLICISTFQMLVHSDPTDAGLPIQYFPFSFHSFSSSILDIRSDYSPSFPSCILDIRSDYSPSFPSSILHFP
jgi:hypothetical protein